MFAAVTGTWQVKLCLYVLHCLVMKLSQYLLYLYLHLDLTGGKQIVNARWYTRVRVCADDDDSLSACRDSDGDSERTQGQHECSYGLCIQMREQVNFVYL